MSEQPTKRFTRWLEHDDGPKDRYLAEIGGSYFSDQRALEITNAEYGQREVLGAIVVRCPITEQTIREWVRDDDEFAKALTVARRIRKEARELGLDKPAELVPEEQWPLAGGRLDSMADPWRVAG
jgi:hypothetical protein